MSMLMEPFALWQRDLGRFLTRGATGFFPPADILVTDEDVTVHLDVPGLRKEDIEIDLQHDVLTIRGERPLPYEDEGDGGRGTWRRIERPFGSFERVLRVPHGLEEDAIEASLHDGVLTLRMRKPQPREPHRIEVKAEEVVEAAPTSRRTRTRTRTRR
ncbi:MAG TPA: Hsp20/alpha crystallin family protein [Conexibacter sp.]|jgi:HSP20 family protein|nr:Hsp20/alpha crystallin family protein [Conexibacter sp.]